MIILNCFLITFIVTTIYNISSFVTDVTKLIYEKLNPGKIWMGQPLMKPFGCSVCVNFWIISFYLLFNGLTIIMSLSISCSFIFIETILKKLLQILNNEINQI